MPKRGGHGRWVDDVHRSYMGHDNRNVNNVRRVSIKHNKNDALRKSGRGRMAWGAAVKFLDDDIDMSGSATGTGRGIARVLRGRGAWSNGRLDSPAPRFGPQNRRLIPGPSPWYQVTIPYGQTHDKDVVLSSLLTAVSPSAFIPHYFKVMGNAVIFYVDDFAIAEKLFAADKKVTMPNGFKLTVKVRSGTPHVNIDNALKEKMKFVMAKRYNPSVKALDLTKFHSDPDLMDAFCILFRPTVLLAVIDIIAENIPELEALNLNDNKLNHLDHLRVLPEKLKCLKILYLGNNRLQHHRALESLKGVPLVELLLEGNPFVGRFRDKEVYTSEIRRLFPKLVKLDNEILPRTIGFDVTEDVSIPPSQASFLCDPQGQVIVRQFLEQYYALYDSDSRQPLLDAYHEQAMMSMSTSYGHAQNQTSSNNRLNQYMPISRNLMRNTDRDSRRRHLKIGRLQVVSFLSDMPKTQHDPLSFTVDLSIFTPSLLVLTINGVFKEKTGNRPPIRAFHRTMVIVPNNGGFCIKNDILFITNATRTQEENSFKEPITLSSSPAPAPVVPAAPAPSPLNDATKLSLVQSVSHQTGMNLHWSTVCLEQTNWDLARGLAVFTELHKEGKIPTDAFVK